MTINHRGYISGGDSPYRRQYVFRVKRVSPYVVEILHKEVVVSSKGQVSQIAQDLEKEWSRKVLGYVPKHNKILIEEVFVDWSEIQKGDDRFIAK